MSANRRWTSEQLRTFAGVVGAGVLLAIVVTAVLGAVAGVSAPKATFFGVLVAVLAMYAALAFLGIRERRSR